MRISWRELDWISERDRHEIERRMHLLGGDAGLLDRVDFSGRASGAAGPFEIRITANAAKRQIIAVRRDPQRVKAFNSAFAALERSVVSVLKSQPVQPQVRAAVARSLPEAAPRPALAPPRREWRLPSFLPGRRAQAALAVAGAAAALAAVLWMRADEREPGGEARSARSPDAGAPELNVAAREDTAAFSAVAKITVDARADRDFSAVARLSASER